MCSPRSSRRSCLTDPRVRAAFLADHRDLLDAQWWQDAQRTVADGDVAEVLSYPATVRFRPPHGHAA